MPLIQGGTGPSARNALARRLGDSDLPPDVVVLCRNGKEGHFDATMFGGKTGRTHAEIDAKVKYLYTFDAGDPTTLAKWTKAELGAAHELFVKLKEHLQQGDSVVVTCVAGQNRSCMFTHALDERFAQPKCEALRKVAKRLGDREAVLALAPLGPERAKRGREEDAPGAAITPGSHAGN
tara:strand:+ start:2177 stop:2713 length:537 start_codon:yes stop_codon:yes gene_type:complete